MASRDENTSAPLPVQPEKLPWHESIWTTITRDVSRLPHALLLHGQTGLGKESFALRLAQFLLCLERKDAADACGRCQSCSLFRVGNHPDFLRVSPLEDSSVIAVDQVRGVSEFLSLKGHTSPHKVVILSPAQAMNVNAANSLLKALEEPPPRSLIMLVATHLSRVPVTIRSRCVRIPFYAPPSVEALRWLTGRAPTSTALELRLREAGGAPITALSAASGGGEDYRPQLLSDIASIAARKADPVKCAERWKSIGSDRCLEWLYRLFVDAARQQAPTADRRTITKIPGINESFSISFIDLFIFLDIISSIKNQLKTGVDETLALEDLMIRWSDMTANAG
jgi:DNA polymerase-3 subunit delta'